MADIGLLDMARQAEQLADFCQTLQGKVKLTDLSIDAEMGRFFLAHKGETPEVLRRVYQEWQDNLLESLPQFSAVVRQCRRQAIEWRAEYNLQEQADNQARKAAEAEAQEAHKTLNG
jgi:hypothetical protein